MLYQKEPKNFNPKLEAAGCFVKCDGKILLLHRQDSRPEGNTWGMPAGKIHVGETPLAVAVREIKEETSLNIPVDQIKLIGKTFITMSTYDEIFYFFETTVPSQEGVKTDPNEHKAFAWISPKDALDLDLIEGLSSGIKLYCV